MGSYIPTVSTSAVVPAITNGTLAFQLTAQTPTVLTQRATYTVPAGRHTILNYAQFQVNRTTAAGTPGVVEIRLTSTLPGNPLLFRIEMQSNGVGDHVEQTVNFGGLFLPAGTVITIQTGDSSTTGTVDFFMIVGYQESNP